MAITTTTIPGIDWTDRYGSYYTSDVEVEFDTGASSTSVSLDFTIGGSLSNAAGDIYFRCQYSLFNAGSYNYWNTVRYGTPAYDLALNTTETSGVRRHDINVYNDGWSYSFVRNGSGYGVCHITFTIPHSLSMFNFRFAVLGAYSSGSWYYTQSALVPLPFPYTINLNANGGSGATYTQITGTIPVDETLAYFDIPFTTGWVPTRANYTFMGWSRYSSSTNSSWSPLKPRAYIGKTGQSTQTFYAVWRPGNYETPSAFWWSGVDDISDYYLIGNGRPIGNINPTNWNSFVDKIKNVYGLLTTITPSIPYISANTPISASAVNALRQYLDTIRELAGLSSTYYTITPAVSAGNMVSNKTFLGVYNDSSSPTGYYYSLRDIYNSAAREL